MKAHSSQQRIPDAAGLRDPDHWVLWGTDGKGRKRPLAPWVRGDLYPVQWGSDAPTRPETDYDTAMTYWRNRETYSAPDGITADGVLPAPLLLHDPPEPPLMLVDLDDVRDPDTGHISDEAADIVDELDAYAEVSTSGSGLHLFVRAALPGGLGKFIADLDGIGHIELYDHGRAVGATWQHLDGTPTTVPERQDTVEALIAAYEDSSQRQRRITDPDPQPPSAGTEPAPSPDVGRDTDNDRSVSPYYQIDTARLANTGAFARHGDGGEGPHPEHGPIKSRPENCTNFGIEGDGWFCFAHDSGGAGLELAAVLCPDTDISCSDVPKRAASDHWLSEHRPSEMLRTCLWLRDQRGVADDADPPYAVLEAAADHAGLHTGRTDGLGAHKDVARTIFDELDAGEV